MKIRTYVNFILLYFFSVTCLNYAQVKHVLILHSYHQGFAWNDSLNEGIKKELNNGNGKIDLQIEQLDFKRKYTTQYMQKFRDYLAEKNSGRKFDVIIVSDNSALKFMTTYMQPSIGKTPIVFCGINDYSKELQNGYKYITGVVEDNDIQETVNAMLRLQPDLETIAVINDSTDTSIINTIRFGKIMKVLNNRVKVKYLENLRIDALKSQIRALPGNSAILALAFIYDKDGLILPSDNSFKYISEYSNVPIYSVWDFLLNTGVIGGRVTSGIEQGRIAGEMARRIIDGEKVESIPVNLKSPNRYIFDFNILERFKIDKSLIPSGSIIINQPSGTYSISTTTVWIAVFMILSLLLLIITLFLYILGRRKVEKELFRAKQLAEKSDNLKSEFLAQMSHEIRTPINSILCFTSLIREEVEEKVDEELKASFKIVSRASGRIVRTINLILNMSEIQTNNYTPVFKSVNILEILEKISRDFEPQIKEKKLDLKLSCNSTGTVVKGDEYSVIQIFDNLIDNAVKYTESGEIEISVSDTGEGLDVMIRDTGVGISEEHLPDLFKLFRQEEQGYTRRFEGNGLGLVLVKKYCEMNNIQIHVKSSKGKGTSFNLLFPNALRIRTS